MKKKKKDEKLVFIRNLCLPSGELGAGKRKRKGY